MGTTPHHVIGSVVRSVCGREVERLVRVDHGGLNEAYRAEVAHDRPVVVRIARRPEPWFTHEEHVMASARDADVPTPEVLGVAIDFALDVLGWTNPASPERLRRCVAVIARHTGP